MVKRFLFNAFDIFNRIEPITRFCCLNVLVEISVSMGSDGFPFGEVYNKTLQKESGS